MRMKSLLKSVMTNQSKAKPAPFIILIILLLCVRQLVIWENLSENIKKDSTIWLKKTWGFNDHGPWIWSPGRPWSKSRTVHHCRTRSLNPWKRQRIGFQFCSLYSAFGKSQTLWVSDQGFTNRYHFIIQFDHSWLTNGPNRLQCSIRWWSSTTNGPCSYFRNGSMDLIKDNFCCPLIPKSRNDRTKFKSFDKCSETD